MNILPLAGIAIVAAIFSVMLKKYNPEIAIILSLVAGIFLLFAILSHLSAAIDHIKELIKATNITPEYGLILFKVMGICFLAQFTADCCMDAGEKALASKIELAGKIMIIYTALPLFEQVIKMTSKLIGG